MSKFGQDVKAIFNEVSTFLTSLKDTALGTEAQAQKKHILAAIQKVIAEYPALATAVNTQSSPETPEDVYDDANGPALPAHRQPSASTTTKTVTATSPISVASTDYQVPPPAGEVIPDIPAQSLTNRQKAGFLGKEKKSDFLRLAQTQKRYCVIQDGVFYYYEKAESKKQSGAFKLADYEAAPVTEEAKDGSQKPSVTVFQVTCPGKRSYTFKAVDYDDMKSWIDEIAKASSVKHVTPADRPDTGSSPQSPRSQAEDIYDDTGADNAVYDETVETKDGQGVYDDGHTPKPAAAERAIETASAAKASPAAKAKLTTTSLAALAASAPPPSTKPLPSPVPARPAPAAQPPAAATAAEAQEEEEETYADVDDWPLPKPTPAALPTPATPTTPTTTGLRSVVSRPLPAPPPAAPEQETISVRRDDYGNMYYGMWDCAASKEFELSFNSGEILHVISSKYEDRGWWTAVLNGKVGLVPKNYLTPAYIRV